LKIIDLKNNTTVKAKDLAIERPTIDFALLNNQVAAILAEIKTDRDKAITKYTTQFDGVVLKEISVTQEEITTGIASLSIEIKQAIDIAARNIHLFHEAQKEPIKQIETMPGIVCWRKSVGIEKVGLYIPGGSAPLFSTILMLGIPASIAGCKEVVLCTPPNKDGSLHPAVLYAASVAGIEKIFKVGGVQAIGAMAYGTETIPKVYKIFGPGNQYVTTAKQLVLQEGVAIDMPAGPSEVCIIADNTANPSFIASDLLSQAEHGADSQVVLITWDEAIIPLVRIELDRQLNLISRKDIASKALQNSTIVLVDCKEDAIIVANNYAAEHLIINCLQPELIAENIVNAGSIFLGNYAAESIGDYASGTNHTLPTNGFAKAYSGVSLDSFVKKITHQYVSKEGIKGIAKTVITMANAEGLDAHANAVSIRVSND